MPETQTETVTQTDPNVSATAASGGDQGQSSWHSSLPDDLKAEKSLASFKDVPGLAKSYVEINKKMGDAIFLPKTDDKPEVMAEKVKGIYTKLGWPADPNGYKVQVPDIKGGVWTDQHHSGILGVFHKAGMTNKQAQDAYNGIGEMLNGMVTDVNAEREKATTTLKEEWKGDGVFERNMSLATRAAVVYGGPEIIDAFERTGAGNDPVIIKAFSKLGAAMAEDGLLPGVSDIFTTKDSIQKEIDTMRSDPKGAYQDQNHPDHERAVEKMLDLNRQLAA